MNHQSRIFYFFLVNQGIEYMLDVTIWLFNFVFTDYFTDDMGVEFVSKFDSCLMTATDYLMRCIRAADYEAAYDDAYDNEYVFKFSKIDMKAFYYQLRLSENTAKRLGLFIHSHVLTWDKMLSDVEREAMLNGY